MVNFRPPFATGADTATLDAASKSSAVLAIGRMANLLPFIPAPAAPIARLWLNSELCRRDAEQVVLVAVLDARSDHVAGLEAAGIAQMDLAVDLGRVGLRAAGGAAGV